MTANATVAQKAIRRKLSLLELAAGLDNVSKACKIMGYSREQFYEIRRNFQVLGAEGLLDKATGAGSPHPSRVSEADENIILDYCLEYPTQGSLRVSRQLLLRGVHIGQGAVKGVWRRHTMLTKHQRLLRLEQKTTSN